MEKIIQKPIGTIYRVVGGFAYSAKFEEYGVLEYDLIKERPKSWLVRRGGRTTHQRKRVTKNTEWFEKEADAVQALRDRIVSEMNTISDSLVSCIKVVRRIRGAAFSRRTSLYDPTIKILCSYSRTGFTVRVMPLMEGSKSRVDPDRASENWEIIDEAFEAEGFPIDRFKGRKWWYDVPFRPHDPQRRTSSWVTGSVVYAEQTLTLYAQQRMEYLKGVLERDPRRS